MPAALVDSKIQDLFHCHFNCICNRCCLTACICAAWQLDFYSTVSFQHWIRILISPLWYWFSWLYAKQQFPDFHSTLQQRNFWFSDFRRWNLVWIQLDICTNELVAPALARYPVELVFRLQHCICPLLPKCSVTMTMWILILHSANDGILSGVVL